ncbi:MAG TPA: 6-bladed beta-propeller [Candidatus Wallbacteria bacterium]|nr:6-bladed beta-propeller [Candidatus Wallbacteria bacterium]
MLVFFFVIFWFVIPASGSSLVFFRNDDIFLNKNYDLDATYYEVNKIINLDNTAENLITQPSALVFDEKNSRLMVGDYLLGKIYNYSLKTFKFDSFFGIWPGEPRVLGRVEDISVLPGNENYAIADPFFHHIIICNKSGGAKMSFGRMGVQFYEFNEPSGIACDGKYFFITDRYNCRICVYDIFGSYKYSFGSRGVQHGQFYLPTAILTGSSSEVYVCDSGNDRIEIFDKKGIFKRSIGAMGRAEERFNNPTGICLDEKSNLYVADSLNGRVQKFDRNGKYMGQISELISSFVADDYRPEFIYNMPMNLSSNEINFSMGTLKKPIRVQVDNKNGKLFVLDAELKKIYIFDSDNFNKGRELFKDRHYINAAKYFEKAVVQTPENVNALFYLGYADYQLEKYKDAFLHFTEIKERFPASEVSKYADYYQKKINSTTFEVAETNTHKKTDVEGATDSFTGFPKDTSENIFEVHRKEFKKSYNASSAEKVPTEEELEEAMLEKYYGMKPATDETIFQKLRRENWKARKKDKKQTEYGQKYDKKTDEKTKEKTKEH